MGTKVLGKVLPATPGKKGLLSRVFAFLRGPAEGNMGTFDHMGGASPEQGVMAKPSPGLPYVPAHAQRKMLAETEIVKSRRPEESVMRFH